LEEAISAPIVVLFSVTMTAVCVGVASIEYRRTRELLSPLTFLCGLAAFDVYLPGAIYGAFGLPSLAPWLSPEIVNPRIPDALLVYTIGLVLFLIGYVAAHAVARPRAVTTSRIAASRPAAVIGLLIVTVWWFWSLAIKSGALTSVQSFVAARLLNRSVPAPMSSQFPSLPYPIVLALELSSLLIPIIGMLTAVLLFSRARRLSIGALAVALIAVIVNLSTFYRGSILLYFVSLGTAAEALGIGIGGHAIETAWRRHIQIVTLCAVGVMLFLAYGVFRNSVELSLFRAQETQTPIPSAQTSGLPGSASPTPIPSAQTSGLAAGASQEPALVVIPTAGQSDAVTVPLVTVSKEGASVEVSRVLRGEGLIGLSAILGYYPEHHPFLGGKTIHDILLLPVPRAIWKDKPAWYGVSDITAGYGEPSGTVSAVTMPGELYANYGVAGLAGMTIYGLVFGFIHVYRRGARLSLLYAFLLLPLVFACFWMGLTGFVNQALSVPVGAALLFFIIPSKRLRRRTSILATRLQALVRGIRQRANVEPQGWRGRALKRQRPHSDP
jgi:hypothetical protein